MEIMGRGGRGGGKNKFKPSKSGESRERVLEGGKARAKGCGNGRADASQHGPVSAVVGVG